MRRLLCLLPAVLLTLVLAAPAGAAPLPGVPAHASLLFTVDADGGTLRPSGDHLTLTLRGVDADATWFTDRPDRNAGRVRTAQLIGAWPDLAFDTVPPNAALVLQRAPRKRDTVALELRDPAYDAARRTLRFTVRRLDALGPDLRRLDAQLDRRISRRFGLATLFIDNAAPGGEDGCTLGQPQLMATTQPLVNMQPADGRTLPIDRNSALASLYGYSFGGDLRTKVGLPTMAAPASGTRWYVCTIGRFPSEDDFGIGHVGEVDLWIVPSWMRSGDASWMPADGRSLTIQQRMRRSWGQLYAPSQERVTLPTLTAPTSDMTWMVCVNARYPDWSSIGQLELFAGPPPEQGGWIPADGRALRSRDYTALDAVINGMDDDRWKDADRRFTIPDVPSPAPGLRYYIATEGVYPVDYR